MHSLLSRFLIAFCLLFSVLAWAQVEESIQINDELDIPIQRFDTTVDKAPILLWLPSSHGVSDRQALTASGLAKLGVETWIVDLHAAYFVDAVPSSVQAFQPADLAKLISFASGRTNGKIFILANGRVSKPALEAVALFQQQAKDIAIRASLGGVVLMDPALSYHTQTPGKPVDYLPIARHSTIPIYFIQPEKSTHQPRSVELAEVLRSGGSPVFFHPLPGIRAGFALRHEDELTEVDLARRARLPNDLVRALKMLAMQAVADPPDFEPGTGTTLEATPRYGLKPLQGEDALPITLKDVDDQEVSIDYSAAPLTLVSFWASWCPPCIKELPAVRRLQEDYGVRGLRIVTINIGESPQAVRSAIEKFSMQDYTNLRDPKSVTTRAWNVYGFPTNFLITPSGKLSWGSIGGVEWDEPDVRAVIEEMLKLK